MTALLEVATVVLIFFGGIVLGYLVGVRATPAILAKCSDAQLAVLARKVSERRQHEPSSTTNR